MWLALGVGSGLLVAVALYAYWPETYWQAAEKALRQEDMVTARAALEHYLARRPHAAHAAQAHLLLAQLDRRANRYAEAEEHLALCQQLGGPAPAIQLERVLMAVQTGVFTLREEDFCRRRLADGSVDETLLYEAFSQGYTKTYRLQEALVCLNHLLELHPNSGYALRRRGWVHSALEHYDRAEEDYRRAVALEPEDAVARLGLAQLLLDIRKNGVEARPHFEYLWQRQKESPILIGLVRSRLQAGDTDQARAQLDDWLTGHPRDAPALTERGKLALGEGQMAQAEAWLRRALDITPYALDANHALFLCLSRQDKTAEAEQCQVRIRQAREDGEQLVLSLRRLQQTPQDADLRCRIAQIFLRQGQEREGERWLQQLLQTHPDHRPAHQALADYYRRNGRADLAEWHHRLAQADKAG